MHSPTIERLLPAIRLSLSVLNLHTVVPFDMADNALGYLTAYAKFMLQANYRVLLSSAMWNSQDQRHSLTTDLLDWRASQNAFKAGH